jgi:hypothetical protein
VGLSGSSNLVRSTFVVKHSWIKIFPHIEVEVCGPGTPHRKTRLEEFVWPVNLHYGRWLVLSGGEKELSLGSWAFLRVASLGGNHVTRDPNCC